jgi:hypothetical protein
VGEPIYGSQDTSGSHYRQGGYGGTSHTPDGSNTTYHGGTYGEYGEQWANTENWIQCAWCYDEWQKEIKDKAEWNKKLGKLMVFIALPIAILGIVGSYFLLPIFLNSPPGLTYPWSYHLILGGGAGLIVGVIIANVVNYVQNGSQPTVDRYRMRKRNLFSSNQKM